MDMDGGIADSIPAGLFMQNGPTVGPQVMIDPSLSLEERIISGNLDDGELESDLERAKLLEILGRTEVGRRRAEEVFGRDVWRKGIGSSGPAQHPQEDEGAVDRMFVDLVNQDEDDEAGAGSKKGDKIMTPADLESERNGMDALLDGD